ncbi:hypothetical protein PSHT_13417 [Puccinia striiformis]|uniref:EF-hand domain-containing protein n=1 Tax=Puccinia striiformis TaxID=27350 RepID=A0A2S4UR83_9BASI|nr:hypothetical protein PSHT_13417 [Puccinia striiformis]
MPGLAERTEFDRWREQFEQFAIQDDTDKTTNATLELTACFGCIRVAFKYFDQDRNGDVTFDEFKRVFSDNLRPDSLPFTFESPWVKLFLGKRGGQHVLGYKYIDISIFIINTWIQLTYGSGSSEFTQLMKGLQGERLRQAFSHCDKEETGTNSRESFWNWQGITFDSILESLPTLCNISTGGKISYSEVNAFHNVIREMDTVERILREAIANSPDGKVNRQDFLNTASRQTRYVALTPMEVDIVFHFAGMGELNARLGLSDFGMLLDPVWERRMALENPITDDLNDGNFWHGLGKSIYNFGLGGIAGAIIVISTHLISIPAYLCVLFELSFVQVGATAVYPIDLVKTRMQNQRSKVVGELLYKNSMDCVKKVLKNEGFTGFYRGLPPQLIGVAPEKAIKLTINDLIRANTKDPVTGEIKLGWELFAGDGWWLPSGKRHCFITFFKSPAQVMLGLKLRQKKSPDLQIRPLPTHWKLSRSVFRCKVKWRESQGAIHWRNAYHSADTFGEGVNGKKLSFVEVLSAAAIAGMPAAYLTTPADVVKTRLQSEARKGETHYKGLMHCFKTILKEEGPAALFKGGPARILRSSPQFGVTLVSYEYLQKLLPFPFGHHAPPVESTVVSDVELPRLRARNAMKILLDVHEDFGMVKRPTK